MSFQVTAVVQWWRGLGMWSCPIKKKLWNKLECPQWNLHVSCTGLVAVFPVDLGEDFFDWLATLKP